MRVLLSGPRGFCAGVDRAIRVVEEAIRRFGAPVYVRHEIVHNRTVVEALEAQGAVFVEELDEVPPDAHVVFSAHGVPKSVPQEAERRHLHYYDATCPLVSKVHREAERHFGDGGPEQRHILMIGHAGHPEVVGTMGQLPPGAVTLVQDSAEAHTCRPARPRAARLHHADHPVGGRHRRHRGRAAHPLPGDRGARSARISATPPRTGRLR